MTDKRSELRDVLKKLITESAGESSNVAKAINVGGSNRHSAVSSRQRVVQKDGVTTKVTETREERRADD